ncbi:hypothetical protein ACQI5H_24345 [Mycobacterium heidelbergense]|uniref:hypothetical protein n=1 Tax=Mycobacterium heidelbergense TaxID=53376 RepID=UPI003CEC6410
MTTPPSDPSDPGDTFRGGPPPGYRPDRRRPRRRRRASSHISTGSVIAGIGLFIAINVPVFIAVNRYAVTHPHSHAMVIGAVALGVIVFGGGGTLLAVGNPTAKAIGLGLMIGWALVSVLSAGYCTGLNPAGYRSY